MRKYIQEVFDRLKDLKAGIVKHATQWQGMPDTPEIVQEEMQELADADALIEDLQNDLRKAQKNARKLAESKDKRADVIQTRATGIHAEEEGKLIDYGIEPAAERQAKPVPSKVVIDSVTDDVDGEGFILQIQREVNSDFYEIEIGETTADVQSLAPPFPTVRTTKRTKYVFDDVRPGYRYYFRVRGANASGRGEWSEVAISGVQ